MALRKAGEISSEKKVPNELTFRKFNATGKYLHDTDIRWCIKNTKISSEKETIKWFKRFRWNSYKTLLLCVTDGWAKQARVFCIIN
jgi:hypothetical protein